jgi:Heterokaryon incompatibility protein (HET)
MSSSNTGSKDCFDKLRFWTKHCLVNHGKCTASSSRRVGDESWSPTRLLDVRPAGIWDEDRIRVSPRTERSPDVPYAVLSYCWGSSKFIKLKQDLLELYSTEGIAVEDLPKTLIDAIKVTRELKLRFLWIDALCIIQDSASDWLSEAVTMSKIYKCAFVSISAAASRDVHSGLFRDRNPALLNGCMVGDMRCVFSRPWHQGIQRSSLQQRGWTFQEHILATRIVHYADNQILWECRELDACENHPCGDDDSNVTEHAELVENERPKREVAELRFADVTQTSEETKATLRLWRELWTRYTSRNFTFGNDKLVALAGIATEFGGTLGAENYLAGFWWQDLAQSLMWYVKGDLKGSGPAPTYRAPSWSWASIDGPVDRYPPARRPHSFEKPNVHIFEALKASTETEGGPFGKVISGSLTVRARICPIQVNSSKSYKNRIVAMGKRKVHVNEYIQSPRLLFDSPDVKARIIGKLIYFLYIGHTRRGGDRGVEGLLLEAVEGRKGQFRRIGVLDSEEQERAAVEQFVEELHYEPLRKALRMGLLEEQNYLEVDADKRYTVEIV